MCGCVFNKCELICLFFFLALSMLCTYLYIYITPCTCEFTYMFLCVLWHAYGYGNIIMIIISNIRMCATIQANRSFLSLSRCSTSSILTYTTYTSVRSVRSISRSTKFISLFLFCALKFEIMVCV